MKQKYTKKQLEVEIAMLRISYEVEIAKKDNGTSTIC